MIIHLRDHFPRLNVCMGTYEYVDAVRVASRSRSLHWHLSFYTLQHTATRCNTLKHTATHCSTLQQSVMQGNEDIKKRPERERAQTCSVSRLSYDSSFPWHRTRLPWGWRRSVASQCVSLWRATGGFRRVWREGALQMGMKRGCTANNNWVATEGRRCIKRFIYSVFKRHVRWEGTSQRHKSTCDTLMLLNSTVTPNSPW